jgi:hypothetical protein
VASLSWTALVVAFALAPGELPAQLRPVAAAAVARPAAAMYRTSFAYHDAEYLSFGESAGGALVVPSGVGAGDSVPLVVFLHGVNIGLGVHMWLGGKTEPDLAPLVERVVAGGAPPFLLAAPSQTKGASSGRVLWKDFDLDDFVQAVDTALGARAHVDRRAVIVLGHSGAGCNPDGGLLRVARRHGTIVPRAILAIDTCLDEEVGDALGRAPSGSEVWVRWQPEIWPRPIDRFRIAFRDAAGASGRDEAVVQRVDGLGPAAHDAILLDTFTTVIPQLVAPPARDDVPPGASDP